MRTPTLVLALTATLGLTALGLTACGDDDEPVAVTPEPSSAAPTTAPTTTAPEPTATAPAVLPDAVTAPVQGGTYVAVYLVVTSDDGSGAADQRAAQQAADALGYRATTSDIDCDRGAREALELGDTIGLLGTSVLFADQADADAFVAAYDGEVVGTAAITAFCLD